MLRRKDNLLRYHYPIYHPNVVAESERFLKIGERPVEGVDHVRWYLDALGTRTAQPARTPACSEEVTSVEAEQERADDNSQQVDDEPPSEEEHGSE